MDIKTKFGVAKDVKIESYGQEDGETYILGYINQDGDEYDLLGFDAPIPDDPKWRFWVESGDKDGSAETNDAGITEDDKAVIRQMYEEYK